MSRHPNLDSCDPRLCISSRILKCNRIISSVFRKHLLQYGITNSQLSILFILAKRGETGQQELSNILYLEKSTVSRNMRRLIENGYLVRKSTRSIFITEKGKDFLEEVVPAWDRAMEEARTLLGEEGDEALTFLLTQLTR